MIHLLVFKHNHHNLQREETTYSFVFKNSCVFDDCVSILIKHTQEFSRLTSQTWRHRDWVSLIIQNRLYKWIINRKTPTCIYLLKLITALLFNQSNISTMQTNYQLIYIMMNALDGQYIIFTNCVSSSVSVGTAYYILCTYALVRLLSELWLSNYTNNTCRLVSWHQ